METQLQKIQRSSTLNIRITGLGGQGVLTASEILSKLAFKSGHDVKKAEVHGMAQRGGSLYTDVRIASDGSKVLSPMIPEGEVDYLVVFAPEWMELYLDGLDPKGIAVHAGQIDVSRLRNSKSLNVALLGALSAHLDYPIEAWMEMLKTSFPEKLHASNTQAFQLGRDSVS
jgi:indolepyruvate ferredoxin oxidoreductase beta subunit